MICLAEPTVEYVETMHQYIDGLLSEMTKRSLIDIAYLQEKHH